MATSSSRNAPLFADAPSAAYGTTEVFGRAFESADERRAHFREELEAALDDVEDALGNVPFVSVNDAARRLAALDHWPAPGEAWTRRLAEHMAEAEGDLLQRWKKAVGFPEATRARILELSDPPFFTMCPNPFLARFVAHYGTLYADGDGNDRAPFAFDVSEGKYDRLYQAHSYHTKVPHKAIMRYLLHYTDPGDIVLDGFAGSGMTGVAARLCGHPDDELRAEIEKERHDADLPPPQWGPRHTVLQDLSPAAGFIAGNFNLPFDVAAFEAAGRQVLDALEDEIGWMYETTHTDGRTGRINYTVWSQVLGCSECGAKVVFHDVAMKENGRVRKTFHCPACAAKLTKRDMDRLFTTKIDPVTGEPTKQLKRVPVLVNYDVGGETFEKAPDDDDRALIERIEKRPLPDAVPMEKLPYMHMTHERARMDRYGVSRLHHFYLPRAAQALGRLWAMVESVDEPRLRHMLLFWVDKAVWDMCVQNSYRPSGYSQVGQFINGIYYIPAYHTEISPRYNLINKLDRIASAFTGFASLEKESIVGVGNTATLPLPDNSVDFVFTDPPFGENIYYADLNFLVESWYRVWTRAEEEAIVDRAKGKDLRAYRRLMQACFAEYARVLKPGRWMTVVFHNSHNRVWHAIQEALQQAGFVVADVRTLDKKQGSYRQVTSDAAKQDLVISCYKPAEALEEVFALEAGTEEAAWEFARTHLAHLPTFVSHDGTAEVIAERLPYLLYDRMVAFHVQRGVTVPLSAAEFYQGLAERFAERDGMYFLPSQTAAYDRQRMQAREVEQLTLTVKDEETAIQWLRQTLHEMPQTRQQLHPDFMQETSGWAQHEERLELKTLLEENFLHYDGTGEVPEQIREALRREHPALREVSSDDARLQREARGRWYVPNPHKEQDLEKMREKELLKIFDEYRSSDRKTLKTFRMEAVRAGFKHAWQRRDYHAILDVAQKIKSDVLEEDPKLLMFRDQAEMRAADRDATDGLPLFDA